MKHYTSSSSEETKKFAEGLARKITKVSGMRKGAKHALVVALSGELGSGKTTFVQGFLRGLGIKKRAVSPTFIIFRRFAINSRGYIRDSIRDFKNLYHVDAYRLREPNELKILGLKEILENPKNIVLVEWAEKIKKILLGNAVWIRFRHSKRENERRISF